MAKKSAAIKNLDEYMLVTHQNIKMALGIGDHYYIIRKKINQWEVLDIDHIRPRLRRGWITITGWQCMLSRESQPYKFFVETEETPEKYQDSHWKPFFQMLDMGVVYIKKDPKKRIKATYHHQPVTDR